MSALNEVNPKPGCCVDGCNDETCMRLPMGAVCADCVHVRRCSALFGVQSTARTCDFYPRRFRLKVVETLEEAAR